MRMKLKCEKLLLNDNVSKQEWNYDTLGSLTERFEDMEHKEDISFHRIWEGGLSTEGGLQVALHLLYNEKKGDRKENEKVKKGGER